MKKVLGLILLAVLFMVGCQDNESILGPNDELNVESHSPKGRVILPKYIKLPDEGPLLKTGEDSGYWYVTELVDSDNHDLVLEEKYEGGIYGAVKVYVKLSLANTTLSLGNYLSVSKEGNYITMDVDKENGIISFGPSVVSSSYAKLDVYFAGLDLSDVTEENLDFAMVNEDGTTEEIKYESIAVDKSTGTLLVRGAVVYSSAQYAWIVTE